MAKGGAGTKVGRTVLVVFSGKADLAWLRLLKRGFRHVFAVVDCEGVWVVVNPMSHRTELTLAEGLSAADLKRHYRAYGLRVVESRTRDPGPYPAPWRLFTCVEAVLRVLGLQAPWVFTPWQLYRHLKDKI